MGDGDVPGGVAADAVAGEIDAVGVDREAAAGVAQRAEHGVVLAGRVFVGELVRLLPVDGDHDVTVAGGLAEAFAVSCRRGRTRSRAFARGRLPASDSVTIVG